MFDTHCHLNFKKFHATLPETLTAARNAGVTKMLMPGTDIATSRRALEIAEHEDGLYAAVGIHPHHVFELYVKLAEDMINLGTIMREQLIELKEMLKNPKAVAVGETGIDRHMYVKTKYQEYTVTDDFIKVQEEVFRAQLHVALDFDKPLIIHNREAQDDLLRVLKEDWDSKLEYRVVFHCCEASDVLLEFAKEHHIFIGVDGDITYDDSQMTDLSPGKKEFIKKVPHTMLVLETDAPFLLPEPLRAQKKYPNAPANLPLIAEAVGYLWGMSAEKVGKITEENGMKLFQLS